MNQAFQDYKANKIKINPVAIYIEEKGLKVEKLEEVEEVEIELPEEIKRGVIQVEDMTQEEYNWLMEKRKKQFAKFGKIYEPPKRTAYIDEEWQREIMQDVIDELRY